MVRMMTSTCVMSSPDLYFLSIYCAKSETTPDYLIKGLQP